MRCSKRKGRQRCKQPAALNGLCMHHATLVYLEQAGEEVRRDEYYEAKVMAGMLEPTSELDEAELNALMHGKRHGDGRRLDEWVVDDDEG